MSAIGLPGAAAANPPPPPVEGLRCSLPHTEAWIGSRPIGSGCLYVAESRLAWFPDELTTAQQPATNGSFSLNYPAISLHGLAKTGGSDARPHLYLLVHGDLLGDGSVNGNGEDDGDENDNGNDFVDDNEDNEVNTEVRFYPPASAGPDALMTLFQAVSDCQALHPDAEDADSDDDEGDDDDENNADYNGEDDGEFGEGDDYGESEQQPGWPPAGSGDQQQPMDMDEQFEDA